MVLDYIVHLMHDLCAFEHETSMGPVAYAIVLAPALVRIEATPEHANLFYIPGTSFPGSTTNSQDETLVGLLTTWIRDYPDFS